MPEVEVRESSIGGLGVFTTQALRPGELIREFELGREVTREKPLRPENEAGDELTLDYLINNSGGDSWPCHCGAVRCRGETARSFFHLPLEIQLEYLPLLAPWFVKRHSRELEDLNRLSNSSLKSRS